MPCRDYYDETPSDYYAKEVIDLKKQVSFAESALCAALSSLEKYVNLYCKTDANVYDYINYRDAGIERSELIKWHTEHMRLDALHRQQEAEKMRKRRAADKKKADALAKLTVEDRKALGL